MSNGDTDSIRSDLDKAYRHLDNLKKNIEAGFSIDPAEKDKILKQRARVLSQGSIQTEGDVKKLELVEFVLAYENYAIESKYISEVYLLSELTPIPCTPKFVIGIINVRGRIISVIDLKVFFDLPSKGIADFNKLIIIKSEAREFGIVADSITGIRSIPVSEIQPSLSTLTGVRERYLKGILTDRTIFLDAATILSDRTILVHEDVKT